MYLYCDQENLNQLFHFRAISFTHLSWHQLFVGPALLPVSPAFIRPLGHFCPYDPLVIPTIPVGSPATTYQNSRYGFRFLYPPQLNQETDDSLIAANHLHQVRLSSTGTNQAINRTDWLIKVWNRITTHTQILEHLYPGLDILGTNIVVISGQKAKEIVLRGPVSAFSGTAIYRVYIITTPYYTYTLNSEYFHQAITPQCLSLLSTFTVYKPVFSQ